MATGLSSEQRLGFILNSFGADRVLKDFGKIIAKVKTTQDVLKGFKLKGITRGGLGQLVDLIQMAQKQKDAELATKKLRLALKRLQRRLRTVAFEARVNEGAFRRFQGNMLSASLSALFFGMQLQRTFGGLARNLVTNFKDIDGKGTTPLSRALVRLESAFVFLKFAIVEAAGPILTLLIIKLADLAIMVANADPDKLKLLALAIGALAAAGFILFTLGTVASFGTGIASIIKLVDDGAPAKLKKLSGGLSTLGRAMFLIAVVGAAIKGVMDFGSFIKGEQDFADAADGIAGGFAAIGVAMIVFKSKLAALGFTKGAGALAAGALTNPWTLALLIAIAFKDPLFAVAEFINDLRKVINDKIPKLFAAIGRKIFGSFGEFIGEALGKFVASGIDKELSMFETIFALPAAAIEKVGEGMDFIRDEADKIDLGLPEIESTVPSWFFASNPDENPLIKYVQDARAAREASEQLRGELEQAARTEAPSIITGLPRPGDADFIGPVRPGSNVDLGEISGVAGNLNTDLSAASDSFTMLENALQESIDNFVGLGSASKEQLEEFAIPALEGTRDQVMITNEEVNNLVNDWETWQPTTKNLFVNIIPIGATNLAGSIGNDASDSGGNSDN